MEEHFHLALLLEVLDGSLGDTESYAHEPAEHHARAKVLSSAGDVLVVQHRFVMAWSVVPRPDPRAGDLAHDVGPLLRTKPVVEIEGVSRKQREVDDQGDGRDRQRDLPAGHESAS